MILDWGVVFVPFCFSFGAVVGFLIGVRCRNAEAKVQELDKELDKDVANAIKYIKSNKKKLTTPRHKKKRKR